MKKSLIFILIVSLLLTACGGAPERVPPQGLDDTKISGKSVEDCIAILEDIAMESFEDDCFEVSRDGDTVELIVWNEGVTEIWPFALKNNQTAINTFAKTTTSIAELSEILQEGFDQSGHGEITTRVSIVESSENRNLIFSAQNGKTVYDIVNQIDTLGVNKARAEAVAVNFEGLVDGAEVSSRGTHKTIEVHLATNFTAEEKPENWAQIQEAILDRMNSVSIPAGTMVYVVLESSGGEILSTVANGNISYDVYGKEDTTALAPAQKEMAAANNVTVYVSKRSNTIHSVSDCSGMTNYRNMKRSEADANGYKYCPNCW